MSQLPQLLCRLEQMPGDWELRTGLVEALALLGDTDTARRLVREAPPLPVPPGIQKRIWQALSPSAGITVEETPGAPPLLKAKARPLPPSSSPALPAPDPPSPDLPPTDTSTPPVPPAPAAAPARLSRRPAPPPIQSATFRLVPLTPSSGPSQTSGRSGRPSPLSAITAAIALHLLLAVVFSAVVLQSYHPLPAHLTVLAAPTEETEFTLEKRKILRESPLSEPASPSPAGLSYLLARTSSPVELPEFAASQQTNDLSLIDAGPGFSQGLTFDAPGVESAVNFFGIESGGQCILFLVEATPHMLLDEKGGMYAYDKVKQEIASLLQTLNRGTAFNLILFDDKKLRLFQPRPVRALPSMVHRAIAWLEPVNRDYQNLGLGSNAVTGVLRPGAKPIAVNDIAHYTKAIQAALEQEAHAIFCITAGWRDLPRSLSPEDQTKLDAAREKRQEEIAAMNLPPTRFDPKDVEAWRLAQGKARDWLQRENEARAKKSLPPKVVLDFGALVRQVTPGAAPPRPIGGELGLPPLDAGIQRPPPFSPQDVEDHIRNLVLANYGKNKPDHPSLNLVLFLGEDESPKKSRATVPYEDHFLSLARRNKGQLKILHGLASLQDLTPTR